DDRIRQTVERLVDAAVACRVDDRGICPGEYQCVLIGMMVRIGIALDDGAVPYPASEPADPRNIVGRPEPVGRTVEAGTADEDDILIRRADGHVQIVAHLREEIAVRPAELRKVGGQVLPAAAIT